MQPGMGLAISDKPQDEAAKDNKPQPQRRRSIIKFVNNNKSRAHRPAAKNLASDTELWSWPHVISNKRSTMSQGQMKRTAQFVFSREP